jgi:hypothetical membrane protein
MNSTSQRLLFLSGILGPPIYALFVLIGGLLTPGYSHVTQSMSELGETGGSHAWIMNTGFLLLGLFLLVFAFALHYGICDGSRIGPFLMAVTGVCMVMVAGFHCDPGCIDVTLTGKLHSIVATISAIAMIAAILIISYRLQKDERLKGYSEFTVIIGIVAGIISLLLFSAAFEGYAGAIQRISMGIPLIWVEVMAVKLFRLE